MSDETITEQVLGKRIENLEYADVVEYFKTPRKESDRREFKASAEGTRSEKDQSAAINKCICAFLNSEGGLLVWGTPVGRVVPPSEEAEFQGNLTHVVQDYGDDQLSNMLFDSLNPRPQGVKHRKLSDGEGRLYVFEVPKSAYSPHQVAKTGTYYFRFNATTRPAPHYLVEALMRRVTFPNIAAYLKKATCQEIDQKILVNLEILIVNHSALQNEENVSLLASTSHGKFTGMGSFQSPNTEYYNNQSEIRKNGIVDILHYGVIRTERLSIEVPSPSHGSELRLVLSVGGRQSPVKASSYFVRIERGTNLTNGVLRIECENYDFHNTIGDLTSTSSDLLREALGRD